MDIVLIIGFILLVIALLGAIIKSIYTNKKYWKKFFYSIKKKFAKKDLKEVTIEENANNDDTSNV